MLNLNEDITFINININSFIPLFIMETLKNERLLFTTFRITLISDLYQYEIIQQ